MKTVMMTVKSSNIDSIGYDEKKFQLLVTFKNGKTFGYKYISSDEFFALLSAGSVGKHFNQFIKPSKVAQEIVDTNEAESDELTALIEKYNKLREHMLTIERIAMHAPIDREILAVAKEALHHGRMTAEVNKNV